MAKPYLILLAATMAVALTSVGLIVWIAADPQYWFPGAYAAKGEQCDLGPRGPQGPPGPPGPVGPDAATAVDDLSSSVDDLSSRIDDLETGAGDQADASVSDLDAKLSALCDAIDTEYTFATPGSELESALSSLNDACI